MSKVIEADDGYYRIRRGKQVRIPNEWVGKTVHPQTIRKRKSKDEGLNKTRRGRGNRR